MRPTSPSSAEWAVTWKLIEAVKDGKQLALARLYEATVDTVGTTANFYLRSAEDAQELVLDVYLYVWKHACRFDPKRGSVRAWLAMVTRNRAIDLFRRRRKAAPLSMGRHSGVRELLVGESRSPEAPIIEQQADRALDDAINSLVPLRRLVLDLAFFAGMSHQEIADKLAMPLGSVKSHIRRALGSLKHELEAVP